MMAISNGVMPDRSRLALVVDDDLLVQELVRNSLRDLGFETRGADTVEAGAQLLDMESFDLVILDVSLPDGIGAVLARKTKALRPKPAVIILTGTPDRMNVRESLAAGVDAYLMKPIEIARFCSVVERLVPCVFRGTGYEGQGTIGS